MREFEGGVAFYEPGKVTPKPRNKSSNTVQVGDSKKKAEEDKHTLEWLVNEFLEQRERLDIIFDRVTDMWNAMKVSRERGEASRKKEKEAADLQVVESRTEDTPVDKDVADPEERTDGEETMDSEGDSDPRSMKSDEEEDVKEDMVVEGAEEGEDAEAEEAADLAKLAKEAELESKRLEKRKKNEDKEAAGATPAPRKKPAPVETREKSEEKEGPSARVSKNKVPPL